MRSHEMPNKHNFRAYDIGGFLHTFWEEGGEDSSTYDEDCILRVD